VSDKIMKTFRIAVFAGDGIGQEVMAPCLRVLETLASRVGEFAFHFDEYEAGAELYRKTGVALPEEAIGAADQADAILLGAMGLPSVRYPNGTEVAPQLDFRERFDLYAGVRPIRVMPGTPIPLADPRARHIDFVLVRESTEGLFHARRDSRRTPEAVFDTMRISRDTSERLFRFAFALAGRRRRGHATPRVTCVDKANVLPAMAFFREVFLEVAREFPDVEADCCYVDAAALRLVKAPWAFDVLVTENMFGDILSDLGAGLVGGMGMAPSADIGDRNAVFQPCHGTAPDIVGKGLANPTAMLLSASMMLAWLADRHGVEACLRASKALDRAVEAVFADGTVIPHECGGTAGTEAILDRVHRHLAQSSPADVTV
jgi:3-isopropylmalate dehydrogenase